MSVCDNLIEIFTNYRCKRDFYFVDLDKHVYNQLLLNFVDKCCVSIKRKKNWVLRHECMCRDRFKYLVNSVLYMQSGFGHLRMPGLDLVLLCIWFK